MRKRTIILIVFIIIGGLGTMNAKTLNINDIAPDFSLMNQNGSVINLSDRKNKGWTVVYFYPKAETPGCTKQACAFRDSIQIIRELNTEVYGISGDTVANQKKFYEKYNINFDLLSDYNGKVMTQFGSKMPLVNYSKRWTFIIDPYLKIRSIKQDVDPMLDAQQVAAEIKKMQSQK